MVSLFAAASAPAPFDPFTFVVMELLIAPLVIGTVVFAKFPSRRKYLLYCLGILGGLEFLIFARAVLFLGGGFMGAMVLWLGFATLTCLGAMATFHLTKTVRNKILGGVAFLVLGCLLMILSLALIISTIKYVWGLEILAFWVAQVFWTLTALVGGILILIAAFKK
jgi:hypothetical protein